MKTFRGQGEGGGVLRGSHPYVDRLRAMQNFGRGRTRAIGMAADPYSAARQSSPMSAAQMWGQIGAMPSRNQAPPRRRMTPQQLQLMSGLNHLRRYQQKLGRNMPARRQFSTSMARQMLPHQQAMMQRQPDPRVLGMGGMMGQSPYGNNWFNQADMSRIGFA